MAHHTSINFNHEA